MIVEKLKSILNLMPSIFYDETLLKNALGRVFFDDKRSQNILFIVIESGVIDNALLVKTVNKPAYEAYVNTLYNNYGIEKNIAKDYIGHWFEALNIPYENFKINLPTIAPIKVKSEGSVIDERKEAEKAIRSLSRSEIEAAIHLNTLPKDFANAVFAR